MSLRKFYDLVIFDWAGTMVDFGCCAPVCALIEAFKRYDVAVTEEEVRRDMGKAKADHVRALLSEQRIAGAWRTANERNPTAQDIERLISDLTPLMREQAARAASLIEGARATVDALRTAGLKIASSTGYTREMMEPVLERAAAQGYAPDHLVCSGETAQGRPSPLMIYKACADLGVWPLTRVIKVDDSLTGVAEGKAAGCLTVGVAASGNGVGLSATALASLSGTERDARIDAARKALYGAGADIVVDSVRDLVSALEQHVAQRHTDGERILLTPGPLTTSAETRAAMLSDWGSWDSAFNALTASVCRDLVGIVNGEAEHVCIPLQGSGTFSVEAAIGTFVPRDGKVLVPDNGAYCKRIVRILGYLGREAVVLEHDEQTAADPARIDSALAADPAITHVAQVHCETGTGILNPLPEIAAVVARHGRGLIVDAMSSYGAIPIDARELRFDALVAASGKCLEGVPGMGFIIGRREALERSGGNSRSLAMDLLDQWQYLQKTGQWRYTPPTHVLAALRAAIDQYRLEGGQSARLGRYAENCAALVGGMRKLGFQTFLPDSLQAPIIVTFHAPPDPAYNFGEFYRRVREHGFILYPGKLTAVETFRVGCIGAIGADTLARAVEAIAEVLREMGVRRVGTA
ncbi:MAG: 2-aminoethylphosphonate--pyruvate transaminase [Sinobacteraceae bacterium]|nr:2-aminoethylphosphonate--pyruvate transaminase [Nevskiaceae bacterium]